VSDAERLLDDRRNPDGGFGSIEGVASEVEATAIAALALGDDASLGWLERAQRRDGSFGVRAGSVRSDRTGLAALALPRGSARERALDRLVVTEGIPGVSEGPVPHDTSVKGWPWTRGAFGWTEPTAWGLMALRIHRPTSIARIDDAVGMLADRECVGGGWNYGNRVVFEEELPAFVQTTALAVLALRGLDDEPADRGAGVLAAIWRDEASGLLSHATATAALRRLGHPSAGDALATLGERTDLPIADTVALAWAAIALGDRLEEITP
jgi:hypothetical protein